MVGSAECDSPFKAFNKIYIIEYMNIDLYPYNILNVSNSPYWGKIFLFVLLSDNNSYQQHNSTRNFQNVATIFHLKKSGRYIFFINTSKPFETMEIIS